MNFIVILFSIILNFSFANPLDVNLNEHFQVLDLESNEWREANYIRVDKWIGDPEGRLIDFPYVEYSNGDRSVFVANAETALGICLNFGESKVVQIDTHFSEEDKSFFERGVLFKKLYAITVDGDRLTERIVDESTPLIKQVHCAP